MSPRHLALAFALTFSVALRLSAQCNLPEPPGTGAQACLDAPVFCATADLDGYCSTTGNTGAGTCPTSFCGNCDNYHWIGFVAGSGSIALTITPSNCGGGTGLEAAIYETDNCSSFALVSNCESPGLVAPISLSASNLTLGQVYYLVIDGFQGDACDYAIDVTQGTVGAPPTVPGGISGPTSVCPGASASYSVPPGAGIANYGWSLSPAIGTIVNDGDNAITVNFTASGVAQLCVTPSNSCSSGSPVCQMVISTPIPPTFQFITFCLGDTWSCGGQTYTQPGLQSFTYDSWLGCDSVVNCVATAIFPVVMPPVLAVICEGESYNFAGQTFSETGQHTVVLPTYEGCDSTVALNLAVLATDAHIAPPGALGCESGATLELDGAGSTSTPSVPGATITYAWTGPGILSGDSTLNLLINMPGDYILTVTQSYQSVECSGQAQVTVAADTDTPELPLADGPIGVCTGTEASYQATASGTGPAPTGFTWTVSGGTFTSNGDMIDVTWTTEGGGTVCVTADNDCGQSPPYCLTVEVKETPTAQFSYQQTGAEVTFADESSGTSTWAWDFGDGNTSAVQNPVHTYTVDGTYEAMLVAGNGICQDTFSQTVEILNTGSGGIEALLEFAVSPSPGDGRFTLTIALSRTTDLELRVVDALGKTVYRQDRRAVSQLREEIDLSGLPPGLYFVQLEAEGKRVVRRYLKGNK